MYTSLPKSESECACTVVKKLSRHLVRRYDEQIKDAGLTITQFAVLRILRRRAGDPLAQVADELEMDRTSLYRAIQPMTRDGWLTAEDGVEPGSRTARLTPKGQDLLRTAEKSWAQLQLPLIDRFGKERYGQLMRDLYELAICLDGLESDQT